MTYAAIFVIVFAGIWYFQIDQQLARMVPASETERALRWAQNCYYEGGTQDECINLWKEVR